MACPNTQPALPLLPPSPAALSAAGRRHAPCPAPCAGSAQAMGTESLVGFVVDCTNPREGSPGMLVSFIVGDAAAKYGAATKEQRREVVLRDLAAVYGPKVCGAGAAAVPAGWCACGERWRAAAVCCSGAGGPTSSWPSRLGWRQQPTSPSPLPAPRLRARPLGTTRGTGPQTHGQAALCSCSPPALGPM